MPVTHCFGSDGPVGPQPALLALVVTLVAAPGCGGNGGEVGGDATPPTPCSVSQQCPGAQMCAEGTCGDKLPTGPNVWESEILVDREGYIFGDDVFWKFAVRYLDGQTIVDLAPPTLRKLDTGELSTPNLSLQLTRGSFTKTEVDLFYVRPSSGGVGRPFFFGNDQKTYVALDPAKAVIATGLVDRRVYPDVLDATGSVVATESALLQYDGKTWQSSPLGDPSSAAFLAAHRGKDGVVTTFEGSFGVGNCVEATGAVRFRSHYVRDFRNGDSRTLFAEGRAVDGGNTVLTVAGLPSIATPESLPFACDAGGQSRAGGVPILAKTPVVAFENKCASDDPESAVTLHILSSPPTSKVITVKQCRSTIAWASFTGRDVTRVGFVLERVGSRWTYRLRLEEHLVFP